MADEAYHKLARVLDTLPNGFPATESGVEINLLKKIFTPEQADLFCDLRLTFETVEEIAQRTGRSPEGLEEKLMAMGEAGQIFALRWKSPDFLRCYPGFLEYMSFNLAIWIRSLPH